MKKVLLLAVISSLILVSCSTAGPFVTNISKNGAEKLSVEKCLLTFNSFSGNIAHEQCSTSEINIK